MAEGVWRVAEDEGAHELEAGHTSLGGVLESAVCRAKLLFLFFSHSFSIFSILFFFIAFASFVRTQHDEEGKGK